MNTSEDDTVLMVTLDELLTLARLGQSMRAAQKLYFKRRREVPHAPLHVELDAARQAESTFDRAVAAVLARQPKPQQPSLFDQFEGGDGQTGGASSG